MSKIKEDEIQKSIQIENFQNVDVVVNLKNSILNHYVNDVMLQ